MCGKKFNDTGTKKLANWQPQAPPDPELSKRLRQYIVEAVYAQWYNQAKTSQLINIYLRVNDRISKERELGQWPRKWGNPGKRTIDRRVNEAADPRFYEDGVPKIAAVTAGEYQPNPELFKNGR